MKFTSILCHLGFHNWRIIETTKMTDGGEIESFSQKKVCEWCGNEVILIKVPWVK